MTQQLLKKTKEELIEMISSLFDRNKYNLTKKDLLLIYLDVEKRIDRKEKEKK